MVSEKTFKINRMTGTYLGVDEKFGMLLRDTKKNAPNPTNFDSGGLIA